MTAIGRELLRFFWAIAVRMEAKFQTAPKVAKPMPAMTGLEAMVAIRKAFPQARIVLLTTYASDVEGAI